MSVPPGTEMFQFPGFASTHYVFMCRYPIGVGCPIRISTDQSLLAAPHGFSQRATSFIASWRQGIHRMPFSCSRSQIRLATNYPPCTETILGAKPRGSMPHIANRPFAHSYSLSLVLSTRAAHARSRTTRASNASEHSPCDRWTPPLAGQLFRSDLRSHRGTPARFENPTGVARAQRRTRT